MYSHLPMVSTRHTMWLLPPFPRPICYCLAHFTGPWCSLISLNVEDVHDTHFAVYIYHITGAYRRNTSSHLLLPKHKPASPQALWQITAFMAYGCFFWQNAFRSIQSVSQFSLRSTQIVIIQQSPILHQIYHNCCLKQPTPKDCHLILRTHTHTVCA